MTDPQPPRPPPGRAPSAPGQASAQPEAVRAPDTNTSVAGEEDPGAALDMAKIDAVDAANRGPAQPLSHRR